MAWTRTPGFRRWLQSRALVALSRNTIILPCSSGLELASSTRLAHSARRVVAGSGIKAHGDGVVAELPAFAGGQARTRPTYLHELEHGRTRIIKVRNLPKSATIADIKVLAGSEHATIKDVVLEYDEALRPVGECLIEFTDKGPALDFYIKNGHRLMAGRRLELEFAKEPPGKSISDLRSPLIGPASGRMVLVMGFPSFFNIERARSLFETMFEIIDTTVPAVQEIRYSSLSSEQEGNKVAYVVQAPTEAEAHRISRRLHKYRLWPNTLRWSHTLRARVLE